MKIPMLICATLLVSSQAWSSDDGTPGMMEGKPTKDAIEVYNDSAGDMMTRIIRVPEIVGGAPLLCRRVSGERRSYCLYMSKETGQVIMKLVTTDNEDT